MLEIQSVQSHLDSTTRFDFMEELPMPVITTTPIQAPKVNESSASRGLFIPRAHHFFVKADITIRPSTSNPMVELEFHSGGTSMARVLPLVFKDWRRRRPDQPLPDLGGSWRVTLYGRTSREQQLLHPRLARLIPMEEAIDLEGEASFWSAAGKVLRLDRAEHTALIRVFPQRKDVEPFAISARASLEFLNQVEDAKYIRMRGVLQNRVLIAQHLESIELPIPEIWQGWIPPLKRKRISALESSGDEAFRERAAIINADLVLSDEMLNLDGTSS
jgi:hypothetical protein